MSEQENASGAQVPCISLLDAMNEADRAMMQVVLMLQRAGDKRWRLMSRLHSDFVAPIQSEETDKMEAASNNRIYDK